MLNILPAIYLFIYLLTYLFNDAFRSSYYIASNALAQIPGAMPHPQCGLLRFTFWRLEF